MKLQDEKRLSNSMHFWQHLQIIIGGSADWVLQHPRISSGRFGGFGPGNISQSALADWQIELRQLPRVRIGGFFGLSCHWRIES
jgi:hypothetical protein